jgi:hypothetical protein
MNERSTDQLGRLMARVESLVLRIESVLPQPLRNLSGVTRLLSLPAKRSSGRLVGASTA